MLTLALVLLAIQSGLVARRCWPDLAAKSARGLQSVNVWLLAGLTLCLFARHWEVHDLVVPMVIGAMLQMVPAALGAWGISRFPRLGRDLLIFSTYGGGNRGILLLTLFLPSQLPLFVAVDLGNFLSLLVFFPWLARRAGCGGEYREKAFLSSWELVVVSLAVASGIGMGIMNVGNFSEGETAFKGVLAITIPLYLGLQLRVEQFAIGALLGRLLLARLLGVGLVVAIVELASFLGFIERPSVLMQVIALFFLLPVSSLAPAFIAKGQLHTDAVNAAVGTATLFALLLIILALMRLICFF